MINLLKLIAKLFGKNAINKTIGTRTNVIQLPNNEIKRYIKQDLNIEAASDAAAMNAKKEMEQLIPEIPKMNDAERLIFEGNLRRLDNRLNPPSAEVFEFGTKQPISKEGIASLTEKAGQKSPPGTVLGNLESRVKQLEASGKSLEEATEGKGKTLDDILGDVMQSQKTMSKLQDEGLVRAAVRYKMIDDLQKGVLKVPKNLEEVIRGASNEEDVINVFRKNYGEDALEQVDSLVPDFYKMTSPKEAVKKIETDFPNIQPKKIEFPETIDIDKLPPEEFATGGRAGYSIGGLIRLFNSLKKGKKIKNLVEQEKIFREGPITSEFLENVDKKFLEPFIRTRDKYGPEGYGLYKNFDEMPAGLQAAELIKRVKTKGGGIDYESAEAFIGKKLKGDETIDELINMVVQPQKIQKATGGRVGFNEGSKLKDYIKTNISASTSSSSPEEGVKVKQEILDGIVSLDIPLNKKLKLLGSLNFGKSRAKVDLSELGKKYGIDLGEQVYKDKYFSPGLGAEYTTDEGTKFNLMVNPEDKQGSVSVSRSFATGGRVGFQEGGNIYSMYQNYLNDLQNKASGDFSVPISNMYQSTITNEDGSAETESTQTSPVGSSFNPTMMDVLGLAINPVMGIANIASRSKTGLSLAQRAMDAFGIGRGPGGRTQGYGVDSIAGMVSGPTFGVDAVNSQSVGADASAGGDAGAAAASAAGANDGPGTGGSFAQGGRVGYSTGSIVKGVLLTAKTLSELKPEYLKKLSRLEGYLGSINMEGKGGKEAAKKTIEKIDNLKKEYQALQKDLLEKEQLSKTVNKNAENELIQARKNVGESQDFTGDDVKYDARLLAEELANVRFKTDYSDLDLNSQLDLFDESYNHLLDLIQERGQIKGAIDVRSGKNILTGKQEMKPEALPGEDPITPKKRTLNASGGLAYLMGL